MLDGEELAGAAVAGLHLVADEDDAVLARDLAQALHPLDRRHDEPALALDGLEHDRGHRLGRDMRHQHAAQRIERLAGRVVALPAVRVRERRTVHLGRERPHARLVRMLLRGQ